MATPMCAGQGRRDEPAQDSANAGNEQKGQQSSDRTMNGWISMFDEREPQLEDAEHGCVSEDDRKRAAENFENEKHGSAVSLTSRAPAWKQRRSVSLELFARSGTMCRS